MLIRDAFNPAETDYIDEHAEIRRLVNDIMTAAEEAERIGILHEDITLCFSRRLFYTLAKYNADLFGLAVMYYATGEHKFADYQVKIVDDNELAAYISIKTIK